MAKAKKTTEKVVPKNSVKRDYEIMFILEPGMSPKVVSEKIAVLKDLISSNGGDIHFEDLTWGERMLMYPIKDHDYGYYGVLGFKADSLSIKEMTDALNIEQFILRFMITDVPAGYKFVKYADIKEHYDIFPETEEEKTKKKTFKKPVREEKKKEEAPKKEAAKEVAPEKEVEKDAEKAPKKEEKSSLISSKKLDEILSEEI